MSAQLAPEPCFHCGLALPAAGRWEARIDGRARRMCCPACAAVAQAIFDSGLGDYYHTRSSYAATAPEAAPALALLDQDGAASEASYALEGMHCAACVWLIERQLGRVAGVRQVDINVAQQRLLVRWDPALCKPSQFLHALQVIGYAAYPYDAQRHGEQLERARKTLFRQLFIAGLSMMQVMMYALPVYLAGADGMEPAMGELMRWASMLLTLPALLYSAQPFWRGAWRSLRQRLPGMDVPVALAIAAGAGASVLATLRGSGAVYFDSITMFIFLLLGSRYLELAARRKAAFALDTLQHALPASALRMAGYPARRDTELVAASALVPGDVILVAGGAALAADGVLLEADAELDLALLTGECGPQQRACGSVLPGGALNAGAPFALRVVRAAGESTLALLVRLAERAGHGKPQIAQWADRVAAWFVLALLLLSVAVWLVWHQLDPARAWPVAVALLVVSCPCALSLATPAALAAATGELLRRGVLVVQPHVLETWQRATHVVFDKTGTLTAGQPALRHVQALAQLSAPRCLALAGALEHGSAHPLAAALRVSAHQLPVRAQRHVAGQGVEGEVEGCRYRLGTAAFAAGLAPQPQPLALASDAMSYVYLGSAAGLLACFELADSLRPDALAVVRACQARGKTVIILSGDAEATVRRVAASLGVAEAHGGCLPQDKLDFVRRLQAGGALVAMVGDGINDAAVLKAADVSCAMGEGAALAQVHADCVLLTGQLGALAELASMAARGTAVIRQNLAWASLYNLAAIPAAAFGLLNPWLAGLGMSLSSAVVVANALRLQRRRR
ncbi:MAG: heavy metal translocating P-type ATPase [Pseudomonadota bacterium]